MRVKTFAIAMVGAIAIVTAMVLGAIVGAAYGHNTIAIPAAPTTPATRYECVCSGEVSQAYPYGKDCLWYMHPLGGAVSPSNCLSPVPGGN